MTCYDVRGQLSALLDGAAAPSTRDALARHVDGCGDCRTELEALVGTDGVVRKAVGLAEVAGPPPGYFESFWPRLEKRLAREAPQEDAMSMSTSGSGDRSAPGAAPPPQAKPAQAAQAAGAPAESTPKPEEHSGLHDIRKLARTTLERRAERPPSETGETKAMLDAAAPAALGHVVLPAPGREVAPPAATMAREAPAAPARAGGRGALVGVVVVLGAAAAVLAYLNFGRARDEGRQVATAGESATIAIGVKSRRGSNGSFGKKLCIITKPVVPSSRVWPSAGDLATRS